MFKISEATAIALHALIYIVNRENKMVSLKEISEKFKISDNHLSKILQRFVKLGVLTSVKGPKGGFSIVPEHKNLSFWEIFEIIEGHVQKNNCIFNAQHVNCTECIMSDLVCSLNGQFIEYMKKHKISDYKHRYNTV